MSFLLNPFEFAGPAVPPAVVSTTAYPDSNLSGGSTLFSMFSGLDLSDCSIALAWAVVSASTGTINVDSGSTAGWTKLGTRRWNAGLNPNGDLALFYKVAPTNNETFAVRTSVNNLHFAGILERISGADTVIWNTGTAVGTAAANFDPPSYDTGASRDYLFTAAAAFASVTASAGPSGYSNFTVQDTASVSQLYSIAMAAQESLTQTINPGAFTNGSSRGAHAIAACYKA